MIARRQGLRRHPRAGAVAARDQPLRPNGITGDLRLKDVEDAGHGRGRQISAPLLKPLQSQPRGLLQPARDFAARREIAVMTMPSDIAHRQARARLAQKARGADMTCHDTPSRGRATARERPTAYAHAVLLYPGRAGAGVSPGSFQLSPWILVGFPPRLRFACEKHDRCQGSALVHRRQPNDPSFFRPQRGRRDVATG